MYPGVFKCSPESTYYRCHFCRMVGWKWFQDL